MSNLIYWDGTSLGPTSCFYWASKLLRGTFWAGLKTLKTSAAAFEGLSTSQPQQLSKASHLLCHGTSLGPTSCFYWASKLLRGTFWAGLQTLKTSAAAFEGLRTSQPSAAAFGHGTFLGPTSCFYWASKLLRGTFWAGLQTLKTSAAAFGHGASLGPTSCFYRASKVARFRQALKPSKPPQQLSKA